MKRILLVFAAILATPAFAGSVVVAKHAALATTSPQATRIGLDVLKQGGNAIDAAVAVAFALAVVQPESGNIGGGGFLIYYEAESRAVWTLDFREVAPAAATRDMFNGKSSRTGALAAGIPGTVAGLDAMHKRFGTQRWKDLVAPAIDLSKNELAATLRRIADKGAADFYNGDIAAHIVEGVRAGGGIFSLRDLREYRPVWRAPMRITFHEFDVYTLPPPSAAGLMIGEELNILGGFDLNAAGYQTPQSIHLLAEAQRRAAIDRDRYLGDPTVQRTPYRDLLSVERAAQWRASINPSRATPTASIAQLGVAIAESAHTTHFSIADADGNIAAITMTLGDPFGSGFVVPGCGFPLNDAMHDFAISENSPNAIAGGRRMATSLAPTIILRRNQPFLALGTSGGAAIPNIVLQTFLAVALYGRSLSEAVSAPRYDQQATPEDMACEFAKTPQNLISQLRAMGHGVREHEPIGDVQALMLETQRITAVSDPRHGGAAGGY